MSRSPARWDPEKLKWMNGEYLRRQAPADIAAQLRAEKPALLAEVDSRMDAGAMIATASATCRPSAWPRSTCTRCRSRWRSTPRCASVTWAGRGREVLGKLRALLADVEWNAPAISAALKGLVQREGLKMPEVMMPLRVAVTGREKTKAIDGIVAAFRRDEVLRRVERASST